MNWGVLNFFCFNFLEPWLTQTILMQWLPIRDYLCKTFQKQPIASWTVQVLASMLDEGLFIKSEQLMSCTRWQGTPKLKQIESTGLRDQLHYSTYNGIALIAHIKEEHKCTSQGSIKKIVHSTSQSRLVSTSMYRTIPTINTAWYNTKAV